jgi:hypothetical protein
VKVSQSCEIPPFNGSPWTARCPNLVSVMSSPDGNVKILIKTELQDDYNVQAPLGISGDPKSSLALSTDTHGQLKVFYINAGKVMNAYQALTADGNAAHIWTVEDTGFRLYPSRPASIATNFQMRC